MRLLVLLTLLPFLLNAQFNPDWRINSSTSINWELSARDTLGHSDNIEMSGRKVSGIVTYNISTDQNLELSRQIFFPQIHPLIKNSDPDWFIYRAYAKPTFTDDMMPQVFLGEEETTPGNLKEVTIDGKITFQHDPNESGVVFKRMLYPSMADAEFNERVWITNKSDTIMNFRTAGMLNLKEYLTAEGSYVVTLSPDIKSEFSLAPDSTYSYLIQVAAMSSSVAPDAIATSVSRDEFLDEMASSLVLETPDSVLNTLFEFSKIRAAESIFDSELGLIHSPGGGRYYVGIWANDQAEYVSPLFPFMGYNAGNVSAYNCYKAFAGETNDEYKAIRYAFEMEGLVPPFLLDRGDAAMIAYGAIQYLLARADLAEARELWPLVEWCLEYCHRKLNSAGVVMSESDEMEGRIETGDANLSTSSLYYGALDQVSYLGKELGISDLEKYAARKEKLAEAVENYFGATVEGLETYKYYDGHEQLRHWICLPLVVGLHERKEATIRGLFDGLWAENGVHVEKNSENPRISNIFWDRGTLYALRGTFLAGATEESLEKLQEFSQKRLLGSRVPYVVEAYPEGNMAHLSAESGLYCRVFTEGLFGIKATGFRSFQLFPRLPSDWERMALRKVKAFGMNLDIMVTKEALMVVDNKSGEVIFMHEGLVREPVLVSF